MPFAELVPNSRIALPARLILDERPTHFGGEGNVFFSRDGRYAIKIYHRASSEKFHLLEYVLELGKTLGEDERFLAWPLAIVVRFDGQRALGVVTARAPSSFKPLYQLIYTPREAVGQFQLGCSWLEYLKMARATASAARAIHSRGMAHADIHQKNFLASAATGEVILIDLDGLVVSGFLPPQVKGMPGFMPPEVVTGASRPSERTDRFSVAVLVLWILLLRNVMQPQQCYDPNDEQRDDYLAFGPMACFSEHPSDRRNWFPRIGTALFRGGALSYRSLSPKLQRLTERAFIDGLHDPDKRPSTAEWEQALAESYDLLCTCSNCRQSVTYPFWWQEPSQRCCPFCGDTFRHPLPSVLELLDPKSGGLHLPSRTVVLTAGMTLADDTTVAGTLPPFSRRASPMVGEVVWDAKKSLHFLVNTGSGSWFDLSNGKPIARGGAISLKPGTIFSFGPEKRLARVVE